VAKGNAAKIKNIEAIPVKRRPSEKVNVKASLESLESKESKNIARIAFGTVLP